MKTLIREVFTVDNLLHSLAAAFFVLVLGLLLGAVAGLGAAVAAGIGLYLREVSQDDWRFGLSGSLHKHLEWGIGTFFGFLAAAVIALI